MTFGLIHYSYSLEQNNKLENWSSWTLEGEGEGWCLEGRGQRVGNPQTDPIWSILNANSLQWV